MEHRERFEAFFTKGEGCWEWQGRCYTGGYGQFKLRGVNRGAHRIAYELYTGELPEGQVVRHSCDNPSCVNPAHLVAGTYQDNMQDCIDRGRIASGSRVATAKLREDEIPQVRDLLASRLFSQGAIAKLYGIGRSTVSHLKVGDTWKGY
jgi:predicted XRE-type DNA-binding protein